MVAEPYFRKAFSDGRLDVFGEVPRPVAAEVAVQMVVDHDSKKITDGAGFGNGAAAALRGQAGWRRGAHLTSSELSEASLMEHNGNRRR